jgi:hypothetical protein
LAHGTFSTAALKPVNPTQPPPYKRQVTGDAGGSLKAFNNGSKPKIVGAADPDRMPRDNAEWSGIRPIFGPFQFKGHGISANAIAAQTGGW